MNARGIDAIPGRAHLTWLLAGLLLASFPHLTRLQPWIVACFLIFISWRVLGELRAWPLPGPGHRFLTVLKQVLAAALFFGVYYGSHGLGRESGVALLVALLGLKVLEIKGPRDYYVIALLSFFLIVTNFFYTQTPSTAAYMLVTVVVTIVGLIRLNDVGAAMPARARVRLAVILILQAVPLMVIAFVLFPRATGPLWGVPKDAHTAGSGLSDTMAPGTISELTLSDEIAFRVEFHGPRPTPAELYWRGPVLWQTDGRTWSAGEIGKLSPVPIQGLSHRYDYTVTLEPHDRRWLFVLDLPTTTPSQGRVTRDFEVLAAMPIRTRISYRAESHTRYRVTASDARERELALQLPAAAHAKAVALARSWRAETSDPEQLVERARAYFRKQPFYYSLTPPLAIGDPVDDFLFRTRRGFCEHYAAAFTVLMRAAGVPARVVTGYQGGELNPIGGYMIIHARDAHAWSEVWLGANGWVRIDPTAVVSPERIEQGIERAIPQVQFGGALGFNASPAVQALYAQFRNQWDAINYSWNQWVLGYTARRQKDLFAGFGIEASAGNLTLGLIGATALLLAVLAAWIARRRLPRRDPVRAAYERFCARLARVGFPRSPYEGPIAYAKRVTEARADLTPAIEEVTRLYVALRYGRWRGSPAALRAAVSRFRP